MNRICSWTHAPIPTFPQRGEGRDITRCGAPIPTFPQRRKEQETPGCETPERAMSGSLPLWGRVGVGALRVVQHENGC
jgi:hypothetical protein